MHFLWDVSISNTLGVVIIVVLTALFVLSATTGVEKGIQVARRDRGRIKVDVAPEEGQG